MEQVRNFIDLVAQGNNIDAKSTLEDLISSRAFDSLEAKKREMASSLFSSGEQTDSQEQ
jgi:DNA polymerase III alpha subunit